MKKSRRKCSANHIARINIFVSNIMHKSLLLSKFAQNVVDPFASKLHRQFVPDGCDAEQRVAQPVENKQDSGPDKQHVRQIEFAMWRAGQLLHEPDRFVAETERIKAAVKGRKRPRVFYEMDAGAGRPFTVGRGSFGHDLVEAAGGTNVFGDTDRPWLQVSAESIVAANPEVIVLADAGAEQNPQRPEQVAGRAGWHVLAAVRNGRIHALHSDWVARPGPRLVLGLRQLAAALHPGVVEPPPSEQVTP